MTPASGRQDHTTSRSASSALVCSAISVHRIPLHVRDDRETPLWRSGTARVLNLIWGIREAIFLQQGLDSFGVRGLICPSGSHIAVMQRVVSPPHHCEEQRNEAVHSFVPAVRMDCLCARSSWRDPAGERPVRVSRSGRPVTSVAWSPATADAKRTQCSCGVCY